MLSLDLRGKVALVTGASGQLGRCLARTLADCGADVAVHYHRNRDQAERVASDIRDAGGRALTVTAEVSQAGPVRAMQARIVEGLGASPHVVVVNAVAQIHPWSTVLEEEVADFESQFRSSTLQCVQLAKAFAPAMIERRGGRFIGISTECVMQLRPKMAAYTSGKRGMDGVLRVLARELGEHQITVNQVAPGYTISDNQRQQGVAVPDTANAEIPLNRRGTDQELAHVVAFLASDLASYVTGAFIPCSGGSIMPGI